MWSKRFIKVEYHSPCAILERFRITTLYLMTSGPLWSALPCWLAAVLIAALQYQLKKRMQFSMHHNSLAIVSGGWTTTLLVEHSVGKTSQ